MYNIPCTSDMLKNSHIPLALSISPFAQLQAEEVSYMEKVIEFDTIVLFLQ